MNDYLGVKKQGRINGFDEATSNDLSDNKKHRYSSEINTYF